MSLDLLTGQTRSNWTRTGTGALGQALGEAAAATEKAARREAKSFRDELLGFAARSLGVAVFLGGVVALGYNQIKSSKAK